MNYLQTAARNQARAWKVIEETNVIRLWQEIGAEVNLVGSLKSGLLMKNLDIDFHIYTDGLDISRSFSVMQKLAGHPSVKEIQYKNLIYTPEECIEWHAWYADEEQRMWQLDMIHIRKGSRYDGVVEKVTDTVIRQLTEETRRAILKIKADAPDGTKVSGIEVYRAVICEGVRNYTEFMQWKKQNPEINPFEWFT